jgi:hypothetical protein
MHLRWSEDHAIAAADFSLRRFRECAIPVPAGSRLPVARAYIRSNRGRGIIQPTLQVALSEQILEAHRSVMEFYLVACALEGRTDSLATVVPRALGGSALARHDSTSASRNFQFELLTAALLRLAGIRGVTLAEPDIRIAAGSTYLGIAAKRIRSLAERKREHHLRKAIDQLRLQGLPGYVFLNLDSVMSDVFQQEGHAAATSLLPDVTQVAQDYIAAIQARDLTRGVYGFAHGVFAFATLLGWDASVSPARLTLHVSCHAAVGVPTEEQEGFLRFLAGRGDHLTHTLRALIQQLEMAAALC